MLIVSFPPFRRTKPRSAVGIMLHFLSLSLKFIFLITAVFEHSYGKGWLTDGMDSLDPIDMLSQSERNAFYDARNAMEMFYSGDCSYEEFREKVSAYANGRFFRSSSARDELIQMDKYGKEVFESYRRDELDKSSLEANKRNITREEFEAAHLLFGELKLYSKSSLSSPALFSMRTSATSSKIDQAENLLGLKFNGNLSELYANRRYWQLIYEGATKEDAGRSRDSYLSIQNQRELIEKTEAVSEEIDDLKNEIRRLRRQQN
jgi:hypothetical protein